MSTFKPEYYCGTDVEVGIRPSTDPDYLFRDAAYFNIHNLHNHQAIYSSYAVAPDILAPGEKIVQGMIGFYMNEAPAWMIDYPNVPRGKLLVKPLDKYEDQGLLFINHLTIQGMSTQIAPRNGPLIQVFSFIGVSNVVPELQDSTNIVQSTDIEPIEFTHRLFQCQLRDSTLTVDSTNADTALNTLLTAETPMITQQGATIVSNPDVIQDVPSGSQRQQLLQNDASKFRNDTTFMESDVNGTFYVIYTKAGADSALYFLFSGGSTKVPSDPAVVSLFGDIVDASN